MQAVSVYVDLVPTRTLFTCTSTGWRPVHSGVPHEQSGVETGALYEYVRTVEGAGITMETSKEDFKLAVQQFIDQSEPHESIELRAGQVGSRVVYRMRSEPQTPVARATPPLTVDRLLAQWRMARVEEQLQHDAFETASTRMEDSGLYYTADEISPATTRPGTPTAVDMGEPPMMITSMEELDQLVDEFYSKCK